MKGLSIDRKKCAKDGICAKECPALIIAADGGDGFPAPTADFERLCFECGHCVAVCPNGAIAVTGLQPEACEPVRRELLPGPDAVEHLLRARRSIRSFRERPIDRATLAKLLAIAAHAPTAHNWQEVKWLIVEDRIEVRRLAGLAVEFFRAFTQSTPAVAARLDLPLLIEQWDAGRDAVNRDAPHLAIAYASQAVSSATADCAIALTYLELAAFSMGLGACWAGWFNFAANRYPPLTEALRLPEGHAAFGALMLGHPRHRYHRIPPRNPPSITWG
jgi:nitroreductase/NAD-dependent dihydropyrimidine dehydrogenase PreA subunit